MSAVIDNGSFVQLGINDSANLLAISPISNLLIGLKYIPTDNDSLTSGIPWEGWGIANADLITGAFSAFANISEGGVNNMTVQIGTEITNPTGNVKSDSQGSAFKSIVQSNNGRVKVTHNYMPSISPNLYLIEVFIENIGVLPIGDLRYRRVMDWDTPPTVFDEWVEIHVNSAPNFLQASNNPFIGTFNTANPLVPLFGTLINPGDSDYFNGPSDQGSAFDFGFGQLLPGQSQKFQLFYGAAETRNEALNALDLVKADAWSIALS
ncbi:hypothetical protein [Bacillus tropicus]|uniref:hypothetical protein n=1 Tax=Bacillus tropicus TaxID=2026188 RepID=UPI001BAE1EEC|nr:hypothetical protein [Bacillus tropicus]QUG99377.1 hypothetical protein HCM98_31650 [Bacillus tropicus]